MKIGVVTSTDPSAGKCRVQFADQDAVISYWLPVLHHKTGQDKSYWMPDTGEHVCCLMDANNEFGCIAGAIYSDADQPPVTSQDKYHVRFNDGTTLEYDRASHSLTANVKGSITLNADTDISITSGTHIIMTAPRIDLN
jgi:phage baseplate assembly protein V